uniref:Cytochrome P450 n=1 Tax=Caenorhabditis japonica TaxID=281687 RepID=A0A8R1IAT3_CAEJA
KSNKKYKKKWTESAPTLKSLFDQLSRLKYMEYAIKEALRLYPMASFANARRCMRTTQLGEYTVEAGVDVQLDTWSLHYDKTIWGEDADEFKPERWSSMSNQPSFLSFGAGPRQCLGMRLAILEEKVLLAHVLRKYSFVTNTRTQIPMKLIGRATTRPANLYLSVKAREF